VGAPLPAEKLGERYAIYEEIASGGMASVHFARLVGPVGFSRTVAVKRLHPKLCDQPEFVRMFLDEARLAARVRHPNVVATIDVVETEDQICLVMEYVHGESLRRLARRAMDQGGRVPRRIAASIMLGSLHGLHAAHEAKSEQGEPLNIVHRDVSPHNVLVGADGIARVIDFGIAKARGQLSETAAGEIKGKFAYMAPEQLTAGEVTRAADIYAASIVFWELLTGRRLFSSKMDATLLERAGVRIPRPSSVVPSLTPALDDIVLRGLSGDPRERFSTAREMARAIEDCIAPASTTDVGEWVERMAGDRLELRTGILAEIEGRSFTEVPTVQLVLPNESSKRSSPPSDPASVYSTHTPSNSAVVPASVMAPAFRFAGDLDPDDGPGATPEPATLPHAEMETLPRPLRESSVGFEQDPATRLDVEPHRAPRSPGGLLVLGLIVLLVGGAIFAIYDAPSYVRHRVARAAAEGGLSVAVGEVVFRSNAVILTENRVEPIQLDGVTVGVGDVEVALHGLSPGEVLVRGFDVTARGDLGDVLENLTRWATAQGTPLAFDARSGHIVWNDAFGKGTALEAWDTSVTASAGRLVVSSPSVTIRTPHTKLGPWSVRIERAVTESSLAVSFDPSTPNPALSFTWGGAQTSAVLDLVRSPLSRLGIPSSALGLLGEVEVAGRSSVLVAPNGKAQGQLGLYLFGVRTEGGASPIDASVTARLNGDSLASLVLSDGQVSSGPSRAPLLGTIAVVDSGVRLDLSSRWPGSSRASPVTLTFDSRDLGTGRP
jgi:serine/threonine protein kinase